MIEMESGGDAGVATGLLALWADRPNWSAALRWQMEGLHTLSSEQFERVADAIERGVAETASRQTPSVDA